jgi:hypothetical protein
VVELVWQVQELGLVVWQELEQVLIWQEQLELSID